VSEYGSAPKCIFYYFAFSCGKINIPLLALIEAFVCAGVTWETIYSVFCCARTRSGDRSLRNVGYCLCCVLAFRHDKSKRCEFTKLRPHNDIEGPELTDNGSHFMTHTRVTHRSIDP